MKKFLPLFILVALLAALEIALYPQRINIANPELVDPDCYMRLVRVEQLYETHDWFDQTIARSNAPYGETPHWSRLLDLILWAGAYTAAPVVGFKTALLWWGIVLSPVLQLFSLVALFWAARPIMDKHGGLRLCLLFLGQIGTWSYFFVGRPDHHSLLLLLFIIIMGCSIRSVTCATNKRYCWLGGLTAAAAMWISVESLATVLMVLATLAILWLVEKKNHLNYARQSLAFCIALTLGSIAFIAAERPLLDILRVEYDKLSAVHILLFGLSCAFWRLVSQVSLAGFGRRLGVAGSFAGISLILMWLVFPDFFQGPFAGIDPRIVPLWLSNVNEVQPLFSLTQEGVSQTILLLGLLGPAFPYLLYKIIKQRAKLSGKWVLFGIGTVIFVPLTLYQLRWAAYAETVLIFPLALLLSNLIEHLTIISNKSLQTLARALVVLVFCIGFFVTGVLVSPTASKGQTVYTITKAINFLNDPQGLGAASKIILANIDFGPEILYRTEHRVVATPYHRNGAGIMFAYQVMTAQTDAEALALLKERQVDLILIYPASSEKAFFLNTPRDDTFYKRLVAGQYPVWLKPITVPQELQGEIFVFKVEQ